MNSGQAVNNYLCANHEPGDPRLHEGNRLAHEVAKAASWRKAWEALDVLTHADAGKRQRHGDRAWLKWRKANERFANALEAYEAAVRERAA